MDIHILNDHWYAYGCCKRNISHYHPDFVDWNYHRKISTSFLQRIFQGKQTMAKRSGSKKSDQAFSTRSWALLFRLCHDADLLTCHCPFNGFFRNILCNHHLLLDDCFAP